MSIIKSARTAVIRAAIRTAMQKRSSNVIHTSPPKSLTNDIFTVELEQSDGMGRMIIQAINQNGVKGLWFNQSNSLGLEASIPNRALNDFNYQFDHYYRGYRLRTTAPGCFIIKRWVAFSWMFRNWDRIWQWTFNHRSLVRRDRVSIIRYFVERTQAEREFTVGRIQLVADLYGTRAIRHPSFNALSKYYGLVLESLCGDGLLRHEQFGGYRLLPKGLTVLHDAEEDDRRHRDNISIQRRMVAVTGVLAFFAAAQIVTLIWGELHPDP